MKPAKGFGWSARALLILSIAAGAASAATVEAARTSTWEPLWPDGVPDKAIVHSQAEKMTLMVGKTGKYGGGAQFVSVPTMTILPAAKEKASRAAVVVFPGGGYRNVVLGKEGMEIAKRLNEMGITAVVVKYRTLALADPNSRPTDDVYKAQLPSIVADGERAVRIVRSRAAELGIDPNKIGVMGFSAGGHLSAAVAFDADGGVKDAKDPVERIGSRPDFLCLIYPGVDDPKFANPEGLGPCFIAVAANDDKTLASRVIPFYEKALKAGVPAELHVFQTGGHGFGVGRPDNTTNMWMDVLGVWMKQNGFCR